MAETMDMVALPHELLLAIDKQVGEEKRASFLAEVAEAELKRRKLLQFVDEVRKEPVFRDEDHPELANGSYAWVRQLRDESEHRVEDARRAWNSE